jgi:chromosome segregation ATPase
MKRTIICQMFLLALVLFASSVSMAQSTAARPSSEQSLQELVNEVRQLRATLQRMNAAVYKGQVIIERYKLQQELLARGSRELNDTREQLSELRVQLMKMRGMLKRVNANVEVGVNYPGEQASLESDIEALSQREQRLAMRETQLLNELEMERTKLNELNMKLNALELELTAK